jgi:secondary thiamine-phosphate synthase enzyme
MGLYRENHPCHHSRARPPLRTLALGDPDRVIFLHTKRLAEQTAGFCDIVDITAKVHEEIARQKIRRGLVTLFVTGSTAALTTIEYEPGLVQDLKELVEKLVPSNRRYHHDDRWGDDNGFSHVRASLFGPSLAFPIENNRALLGTWQQIVLLDFDNRPRTREIIMQLIGESE